MQWLSRSKLIHVLTGALFFLLFPIFSNGENSLDELVFLSCETKGSIKKDLQNGYRAFIVQGDAASPTLFDEANNFLAENTDQYLSIIIEQPNSGLLKKLGNNTTRRFLAIPGLHSPYKLAGCKADGKRLFIFTPEETPFSFSIKKNMCTYRVPATFPADINSGFADHPENNLVIFRADEALNFLADSLKQHPQRVAELFNTHTGKLPNFFVTSQPQTFEAYYREFTQHAWYTANVIYNDKPLAGITWKAMPQLKSFGKIHTTKKELSPYKNGFHFSPDVFTFNNSTSETIKLFYARQKDLLEEVVLLLRFEQDVTNAVGTDKKIPFNNISYKKDSVRGWCAVFNGTNNYIDYDTDIQLNKSFTVSAWVKPTAISGNRSIIGKGKALSVKFRDGNLLFTSPGIKDHVIDSAVVKVNQWQQITYVISAGENVRFFRNGQLVGIEKAAEIIPTEYSLLIGTNLWDEFFEGMMDELTIWDRILSDEEVLRLYAEGLNPGKPTQKAIQAWSMPIAGLAVFVILLFLFILKKIKYSRKKAAQKQVPFPSSIQEKPNGPSVEVFGGFKIVNRNGEDLTLRFSTRRKQFFMVVLIATLKENGISSKQLTNYLWAGYSQESAKNNRSTQVQRIREIIARNSGISIEYGNKKWTVNFEEDVYCDLANYFRFRKALKQSSKDGINYEVLDKILCIIEKGPLLPHMDDEWLDNIKSQLTDELLDTFLPLFTEEAFLQHSKWVLRLAHALLIFDPLNETLLSHKIQSLVKLGKNTQAHECLEHFEKYYQQCYAQPFGKSIANLIENQNQA